jgi:N-acetylneuraminic acid mutarotase
MMIKTKFHIAIIVLSGLFIVCTSNCDSGKAFDITKDAQPCWKTTTSFPYELASHSCVANNGFLYVTGGGNSTTTAFDEVHFASINENGTIGAWTSTASFPTEVYGHTSVVNNGYLYIIGGYNGIVDLDSAQYAHINADGTVSSSWTDSTNFSPGRSFHSSVVYNNYIYVIGGVGGSAYDDIQFAQINPDGSLQPWFDANTAVSFTTARYGHTSVVYNGYLYVIGGTTDGFTALNDVQYAPINADGTIGAWSYINSSNFFDTERSYHSSVVYNESLFVIGGIDNSTDLLLNDVQYSDINSNGTINRWRNNLPFITARMHHASVVYNGYLYVIGGSTSGTAFLNDVQYLNF